MSEPVQKPGTDGSVHWTSPCLADSASAVRDRFVSPRFLGIVVQPLESCRSLCKNRGQTDLSTGRARALLIPRPRSGTDSSVPDFWGSSCSRWNHVGACAKTGDRRICPLDEPLPC